MMTKKPIHAVISGVLGQADKPMSAREIYDQIRDQGLYEFKAKDPASIVRGQLRRHYTDVKGSASVKYFRLVQDGCFELLEFPDMEATHG
jgi:hypothetical protein